MRWRAFSSDQIVAGDVVVIRYEGPKGGPGMQEMLYPTSYLKSRGLGKECALLTDGRFSGGTSGLSIGHASPGSGLRRQCHRSGGGGTSSRSTSRTAASILRSAKPISPRAGGQQDARLEKPANRVRHVSAALQAYAALTTNADTGAVRDVTQIQR